MKDETEKIFYDFQKFLEQQEAEPQNEKELEEYVEQFMEAFNKNAETDAGKSRRKPQTSEDYMDLAMEADNAEDALIYAKRALMKDKDNLDAEVMVAELSAKSGDERQKSYRKLIKKAEKKLEAQGLWDEESFGIYWGIWETRPYMRLRYNYIEFLIGQGKRRKAIAECEDMLRLCKNDNIGIRYKLMHLYAFYEDEVSAQKLYKKYEGYRDTMMLLPFILLYYRLDDYVHAKKYLKLLCSANPETEKFFLDMSDDEIEDSLEEMAEMGAYAFASVEEFLAAISENQYLYMTTSGFAEWIVQTLKKL